MELESLVNIANHGCQQEEGWEQGGAELACAALSLLGGFWTAILGDLHPCAQREHIYPFP